MERIALIYDGGILYGSRLVIVLAVSAAICGFLSLYLRKSETPAAGLAAVPIGLGLSLVLSRLLYWYAFPESCGSLWTALTDYSTGSFVLLGAFLGCPLAAELTRKLGLHKDTPQMLDCMCLAGGAAIAVGRLSSLFNASARGEIIHTLRSLPWICPVVNGVSGVTEYRLATFLLQAMVTALITAALALYSSKRDAHRKNGDITLLFLLCYCAAQILLDSTRYDSVTFRSNGFISIVQVSCGLTMVLIIAAVSVRFVKKHRLRVWNLLAWSVIFLLLALTGYMEYYVQRHSNQAPLAYSVMALSLAAVVAVTLIIYHMEKRPNEKTT